MKLRFHCPHCPAEIDWIWRADSGDSLYCPRCSQPITLKITDSVRQDNKVDKCPVCTSPELFIRKNFPQGLGVAIVFVAAVGSFWFLKSNWFIAWGLLLAAVLADVVLYRMVGMVTCCYRCKAEIRGAAPNAAHTAFDLPTAEKYS